MENNDTLEVVPVEEEMESNDEGLLVPKTIDPKIRSKTGRQRDPRSELAWEFYVKSWREGKPNAKQAGLNAGYAYNTAVNLSNFKWFKDKKDKLRRSNMLTKAERNISRMLNLDYSRIKVLPDGTEEETIDRDVLRVVADVSKTIVTTLGKDMGYSTKTEIDGKMGGEINIKSISYADPIEIEAQVVDDTLKVIEGEVVKEVTQNDQKEN